MKKISWVLIAVAILVLVVFVLRFFVGGSEDSWIKDSRGVWIKHGNPASVPNEVLLQQEAVNCAVEKYNQEKAKGVEINSQCLDYLGACGDYSVDIVHVPRNAEDDLAENQCEAYRSGTVNHFIELDKEGEVVRIA